MKLIKPLKLISIALMMLILIPVKAADRFIILASTTSTQASGFFEYYLPLFTKKTGIEVRVVAVGTGQALKLGKNGDADVLLVHDKTGELEFIEQGYGKDRREVMYNDFIIVGPGDDPARVNGSKDAVAALKKIALAKASFVSRGDDSGTHRKERRLWAEASIDPRAAADTWYKEAGAGMGTVLNIASSIGAYTLTDRATWISFKNRGPLMLLNEDNPPLFNQYALMRVNPERHPQIKTKEALAFMDWMTSEEGQQTIAEFTMDGEVLFRPNAHRETSKATETDG